MSTAAAYTLPSTPELEAPAKPKEQKYRPDFDGLRAVAVLAVMALHVHLLPAPGGVDVFFVLSGFLISRNILRSLARSDFTFTEFYIRRVRRIFPPLIVVLVVTWVLSWLLLLPDEYQGQGRYMASGAAFVSNFVSYRDASSPDPLRAPMTTHLWSLSLEEQFYLFWPIFLVGMHRLRKSPFVPMVFLTVISYGMYGVSSYWYGNVTSLLTWNRVCELSFGGAYACIQIGAAPKGRVWAAICSSFSCTRQISGKKILSPSVRSVLGAVLLVAWFGGLNRFQSWAALVPCMATVLIISADPQSWFNRYVLGAPPMVFVGRISYPLYLWHIPVLMVGHITADHWGLAPTTSAIAVLISFILAFVTYRYVELPFRSQWVSKHMRPVACALGVMMGSCAIIGYLVFDQRLSARTEPEQIAAFVRAAAEDWKFSRYVKAHWNESAETLIEVGGGSRKVLFIGDSDIRQYYSRVARLLSEHPENSHGAVFATRYDCAPAAIDVIEPTRENRARCLELLGKAFDYAKGPNVDAIVIGAAWYRYFSVLQDLDHFGDPGPLNSEAERALSGLGDMAQTLSKAGKRVYIILNLPVGFDLDPRNEIRRTMIGPGFRLVIRSPKRVEVLKTLDPIVSDLRKIADKSGATAIDPVAFLCNNSICPGVYLDNIPIYQDMWTLSSSYVKENVRFLDNIILDQDNRPVTVAENTD